MVVTQPVEKRYVGERCRFYGARPWCDVPAVVFNTKPAPCFTQRRRACALCLSGGGAARKLAARARRAALDVVELRLIEGRRPGARPLSFDAPHLEALAPIVREEEARSEYARERSFLVWKAWKAARLVWRRRFPELEDCGRRDVAGAIIDI